MDPIFISNARLSFPVLVEPQSSNTNDPNAKKKYRADLLMEESNPAWGQIMAKVTELANAQWAEHAQQILQMIYNERRLRFFGKGEERVNQQTMQVYDGYPGMAYVSASRDQQPQMIKPDGSAADPNNTMECQQIARQLYGGCYVNAAIRPWIQDNQHGRGVRCELVAVQFARDGEAFGQGVTDASNMFGAVAQPQGNQPTPAGAPMPQQSQAPTFGQPSTAPAQGMPAAPFPTPGMPDALGGE